MSACRPNGWTGGQYSVFRAALGGYLAIHFLHLVPWGAEVFSNTGMLGEASASPLYPLFPNLLFVWDAPAAVVTLLLAGPVLALAFALGARDRIAALAIWYLWACLFTRNPLISNPGLPFIGWILIAHTLMPARPYGSWDARGRADPGGGWRFPASIHAAAWIVMAIGYSYSGLTKLVSPSWLDGSALLHVLSNPLARPTFLRETLVALPDFLIAIATWGALGLEIAFAPLALFRRLRPWLWLAMLGMHLSLMTLIDFADLSAGMVMLHFFTFDPAWVKGRDAQRGATIFYDGGCGLCHRFVRFALAEDRTGERFRFAPLESRRFAALRDASAQAEMLDGIAGETWLVREHVPGGWDWFGSRWYAEQPFPTFRDGETEWDRQIHRANPWLVFELESTGEPIPFEVVNTDLRAVVALPTGDAAAAEVEMATIRTQRRDHYHAEVNREAIHYPPIPVGEGAMKVHRADWREDPQPDLAVADLAIDRVAAPGEALHEVLWVYGGQGDVQASVQGDLPHALRQVHWLDDEGSVFRPRRARPSFVREAPDGVMMGEQGTPVGVVVDLTVPTVAEPGSLAATVRLERGDQVVEVPVSVRVRDLQLREPRTAFGFYYDMRTPVVAIFGSMSEQVLDVTRRDFTMMRERGLDAIVMRRMTPWPDHGAWHTDWPWGQPEDTSVFEAMVGEWRALGGKKVFWSDAMYVNEGPMIRDHSEPVLSKERKQRLKRLAQAVARVGDASLYLTDEAGIRHADNGTRLRQYLERLRPAMPEGAGLAGAIPHPSDWQAAHLLDEAVLFHSPAIGEVWADHMRELGTRPWAYSLGIGRDMAGIITYGYDVEGMLHWHWNVWWQDPFVRTRKRGSAFTFLGPKGVIYPRILLESFADGVIDARYLTTLEHSVFVLECSGKTKWADQAAEGRALLTAVHHAVQGSLATGPYDGTAWNDAQLRTMRIAVGDEAERLAPLTAKAERRVDAACMAKRLDRSGPSWSAGAP